MVALAVCERIGGRTDRLRFVAEDQEDRATEIARGLRVEAGSCSGRTQVRHGERRWPASRPGRRSAPRRDRSRSSSRITRPERPVSTAAAHVTPHSSGSTRAVAGGCRSIGQDQIESVLRPRATTVKRRSGRVCRGGKPCAPEASVAGRRSSAGRCPCRGGAAGPRSLRPGRPWQASRCALPSWRRSPQEGRPLGAIRYRRTRRVAEDPLDRCHGVAAGSRNCRTRRTRCSGWRQ